MIETLLWWLLYAVLIYTAIGAAFALFILWVDYQSFAGGGPPWARRWPRPVRAVLFVLYCAVLWLPMVLEDD